VSLLRQAGAHPALHLVWRDNATRAQETGHGLKLHRYDWSEEEFVQAIGTLVSDTAMRDRLKATSAHMQTQNGARKVAHLLDQFVKAEG
jgi:UDP:flavonoid glycosyltransferase YjiC (YdhE family)